MRNQHSNTFSILYLILSSAFANFCFLFFPLTPSRLGSLLLADFLFCFSLFLWSFNLFLVCHFFGGGGSISWVSNLSFPWDITRLTEPWLKFLKTHQGFDKSNATRGLEGVNLGSDWWRINLEEQQKWTLRVCFDSKYGIRLENV